MSYCILFWGPSTVSRAFLAAVKTRGFGPFMQFYELLHIFGMRRHFRGHFWHLSKLVDLVLSRSFMSYCKLFRGPSTVSRAFLAAVKTRGFGRFMSYCILFWGASTLSRALLEFIKTGGFVLSRNFMSYCILFWGPSIDSKAFLAFIKTSGFGPFSQFYELLYIVLGSVDSFECIFGSNENSWIQSFLADL